MSTSSQLPETVSDSPRSYQICTKTIMDTSDPLITFDENGVCNHYHNYFLDEAKHVLPEEKAKAELARIAERVRRLGESRPYDCVLGLSGGVDSTYLCLLAKELNLRPLVVHFDNGWNSELAVNNIENTVKRLGFDLYTYVCDWPEFRDLQRSYFKANVVDIEVLTDHGFMAALYQQARKHKIKFVLGGMNVVTESILPSHWVYAKSDLENLKSIQQTFGTIPTNKLKSYPMLSPLKRRFLDWSLGIEVTTPLNLVDYRYDDVKSRIIDELDWRDYGGKHYESVFTRFYQGYILPNKFKFDKRRAHLSTLVCSNQMTRDEALQQISTPGYDEQQCSIDRTFVLKKLGFSEQEFDDYIAAPRVEHAEYGTQRSFYETFPVFKPIRPLVRAIRRT